MTGGAHRPRRRIARAAAALLLLSAAGAASLPGCAPRVIPAGPPVGQPALAEDALVMADGVRLPLRVWRPPEGVRPRAVVLALHGFNDHAGNFMIEGAPLLTGRRTAPPTRGADAPGPSDAARPAPPAQPIDASASVGASATAAMRNGVRVADASTATATPDDAPMATDAPPATASAGAATGPSADAAPDGAVILYAYDQRGFGRAPNRGYWPGARTLAADAAEAARLLRARHPDLPLYLMGESMGGAVAILAGAGDAAAVAAGTGLPPPPVDGYILMAPAVWGRATMGELMRAGLWFVENVIPPWVGFYGSFGGISASDNTSALRRFSTDPHTVKTTRVDAAMGLMGLMDAAVAAFPACCRGAQGRHVPVLVLYGANDRVIPNGPARAVLGGLPPDPQRRIGVYENGWHLLLRDARRAEVARDILAWIAAPDAPLPSGADAFAPGWLAGPGGTATATTAAAAR